MSPLSSPTRRSSDLGIHGPPEGLRGGVVHREGLDGLVDLATPHAIEVTLEDPVGDPQGPQQLEDDPVLEADRKSSRLNSSHVAISYAVFCLKKKKNKHVIA